MAVNAPVLELNVKLVPVFGGRFPVAAVANSTLQEVSVDSSARVTLVAVVAVSALPVTAPVKAPTKDVAVNAPDAELNVRFVPVLGPKLPVAPVANTGKHEVSLDSSANVIAVAVEVILVKFDPSP